MVKDALGDAMGTGFGNVRDSPYKNQSGEREGWMCIKGEDEGDRG